MIFLFLFTLRHGAYVCRSPHVAWRLWAWALAPGKAESRGRGRFGRKHNDTRLLLDQIRKKAENADRMDGVICFCEELFSQELWPNSFPPSELSTKQTWEFLMSKLERIKVCAYEVGKAIQDWLPFTYHFITDLGGRVLEQWAESWQGKWPPLLRWFAYLSPRFLEIPWGLRGRQAPQRPRNELAAVSLTRTALGTLKTKGEKDWTPGHHRCSALSPQLSWGPFQGRLNLNSSSLQNPTLVSRRRAKTRVVESNPTPLMCSSTPALSKIDSFKRIPTVGTMLSILCVLKNDFAKLMFLIVLWSLLKYPLKCHHVGFIFR